MNNNNLGALPTKKTIKTNIFKTVNGLCEHYLNHKIGDLPEPSSNLSSETKVIDRIIGQFYIRYYKKFEGLSKKEIEASAKEAIVIAANKFLQEEKYNQNFDFCKFASSYLKFFLKLYFYQKTIDKSFGKLPDNDQNRKIYFNLNKWKKELSISTNYLSDLDIKKISLHANINYEDLKLVINFLESLQLDIDSSDKNKESSNSNDNKNLSYELSDNNSLEINYNNNQVRKNLRKIIFNYSKKLSRRDKKIFITYTIFKKTNLKNLSSKFNLSQERIRQISNNEFDKFKNYIQTKKQSLELMI